MSARKDRPQISETPLLPAFQRLEMERKISKSGTADYKGGRKLRCSTRFELWRSTERLSLNRITSRLLDRVSKFGISEENLWKALYRLEEGKHMPPSWLILALMQTYQIQFPWEDFLEADR